MHDHATMGKSVKHVKKVEKIAREERIEKKNPVVILRPLPPAIVEFYLSQMYGSNWSHYKGGYYFRNKHPYSSAGPSCICCDDRSGRCTSWGNPRYNAPYYGQQQQYFSEQWDQYQFANNEDNSYQNYRQYQQSYQYYDRFQQASRRSECYSDSRNPRHSAYSYSQSRSRRCRGKKSHNTLPYQKPTSEKKLQSPVRERSSSCDTYEVLSEATCSDVENDAASKASSRRSSVNSECGASSTNSVCTSPLRLSEESCDPCDVKSEKSDHGSLAQKSITSDDPVLSKVCDINSLKTEQKPIASDNNLVIKVMPDEDCNINPQKSDVELSTHKPIASDDLLLPKVTPDEDCNVNSDEELLSQKPRTSDDNMLPKTTPDIDSSTAKDVEEFNISSVRTVSNDAVLTENDRENLRSQRLVSPDQMPDFKGSALKELPQNATDEDDTLTVIHHEENTANCDEVDDSGCEWDNSDVETLPYESESDTVDLALGGKGKSDCESEVLVTDEQHEPENADSPRENASLDVNIPCASARWKLIKFFSDSGGKQENEVNRPLSDSKPVSQYDDGSPKMLIQVEKETLEGIDCNILDPRKCDQNESCRNENIPENLPSLSASPLRLESEVFTADPERTKSVHSLDKTDVSSQKDSEHQEQLTKPLSHNVTLPSESAAIYNPGIQVDKSASSGCSGIDITKNNTLLETLLKNKAYPVNASSAPAGDVLSSIISNMDTMRYSLPVSIPNFSLTPKEPTRLVTTERSSKSLMMKGSSAISKSPISKSPMRSPPVFKSPTTSPSRTVEPPSPIAESDKRYSRLITYDKWKENRHSKKRKQEKSANDRSIKIQRREENNTSKEVVSTKNERHSEEAEKLKSRVLQKRQAENNTSKDVVSTKNERHSEEAEKLKSRVPQKRQAENNTSKDVSTKNERHSEEAEKLKSKVPQKRQAENNTSKDVSTKNERHSEEAEKLKSTVPQKRQAENNTSKDVVSTKNERHSEEAEKLKSKVPQKKASLEITKGSHEERKAYEKQKCITNLHIKEVEKECEVKIPTEVESSKKNDIFRRNSKFMEDYRKKSKVKRELKQLEKDVNPNSKCLKNSAPENTTKKSQCIANEYKCIVCKTFFRQTKDEETCVRCLKRNKKTMDSVALNRKGTSENKIPPDWTSMKNKSGKTKQSVGDGNIISKNVKSSVSDVKQSSVSNKDKMNMPNIKNKTSNSFEQDMPTKSQNKSPQYKRRHSVENEAVAAKVKSQVVEPKKIIPVNELQDKHRHKSHSESASSVFNESKKTEQHSGTIRFSKQEVVNGMLKLTFSDDDMLPYSLNTQKRSLENSDSEESLPDLLHTSSQRNTGVTNVVPTVEAAALNTNAGLTIYQQQPEAKPDQVSQAVNSLQTIKTFNHTWNPLSDNRSALIYANGSTQKSAHNPQKSVRTIAPKPAQECVISNITLITNPETLTKHQNNPESANSNIIISTAPLDSSTTFVNSQQEPMVSVVQTLPEGDRTSSVSKHVRSMPLYQNGCFVEPSSVCVSPSNIPEDSSADVQIKIQDTFSYKDIENIPSPYRQLITENESTTCGNNENEIIDITSDDDNSISLEERKIEKPFPKIKEEAEVTPHKDDSFNKEDMLSKLQTDHGFIKFLEQLKVSDTVEECHIKIPQVTEDTNSVLVLYHAYMMGTLTSLPPEKIFKCITKLLGDGKKPEEIYTEQKKVLKNETVTKANSEDKKSLPSKTAETVTKADSKDEKSLPSKTAETVTKADSKDEKSLPSKTAETVTKADTKDREISPSKTAETVTRADSKDEKSLPSKTTETSSLSQEISGPRIDTQKQNSLFASDFLVSLITISGITSSVPQSGHQSQVALPSVSAISNTQGSILAKTLTNIVASHTPSPQPSNTSASNEAVMPLVKGENLSCIYRTAVHNPAVVLQNKQVPQDRQISAQTTTPVDSQQNPLRASTNMCLPTDRNSAPPNQTYSGSNMPFLVSHLPTENRRHSVDYQSPIGSRIPVIGSSPRISSVPVNQSYANTAKSSLQRSCPSSVSAPMENVYALGHNNVNQNVTTTNTLVDTQSVVKNGNAPQFAYTQNSSLPSSVSASIENAYALGHNNVNQNVTTTNTLVDTQSVVKNGNVPQFAYMPNSSFVCAPSVSITEAMNTPSSATDSVQSRTHVVQPTSTYSSVAALLTSNQLNHLNTMVTNLPQPILQHGPVQSSPMHKTSSSFVPSYTGYAQVPSGNVVQPRPNYYQNLPSLPLGNAGVPSAIANSPLYQHQPASTLQRQNQVPQAAVPQFYSPAGQHVATTGTYYPPTYYPHQQQMTTGVLPSYPTVPRVQSYPRQKIGPPNVCVPNNPRIRRPLLAAPAPRIPSWHTPQQLLCSHCGKNALIGCRGNCKKKFFCNVACRDMHWNNGHCYECI